MKSFSSSRFFLALLLLVSGWPSGATAQAPAAAANAPADPAAAAPPAQPAARAEPAPTPPAAPSEPELRRLDEPTPPAPPARPARPRRPASQRGEDAPFGDHVVEAGVKEREVVSVFGSSTVNGEVSRDVVSVFGSTRIGPEAKVGGEVVAIFGRLEIDGPVGGEAVSVLGGARINSHVRGEAVAVLGNLELGPNAVIDGEVVVVGGRLIKHPQAVLRGGQVSVPGLPGLEHFGWLSTWFNECLLWGRPLAFGENLGWAWVVALSFLGLYLLLALIFPRGIERSAITLETRPGYSILASILTVFLTPVALVLLAVTLVGILLIPFFGAGLLFAKLFGKAVMLAWLGRRVERLFGPGPYAHPVVAVLIGGVIVLLLYTVPVFGLMLYKLLSWLGVGVVLYTIVLGLRREKPAAVAGVVAGPMASPPAAPVVSAVSAAPTNVAPPVIPPPVSAASAVSSGGSTAPASVISGLTPGAASVANFAEATDTLRPVTPVAASLPPLVPEPPALAPVNLALLPRAGLLVRLGALFVDVMLVAIVLSFSSGLLPQVLRFDSGPSTVLPLIAIYGAVMWKTKGTTIGGIIFGLKVVRVDGREMDWATAAVRALSCFLSLMVAGLGFLWVAIDEERQSWHDKIAGTAVVRVPKGMSLL